MTCYKVFNITLPSILGNSKHQSIDEHICTFKGKSSIKQYIKSKPINAFIVYEKLEKLERLILKDFKLLISQGMIASFGSRRNFFPNSRPSRNSRKFLPGPDSPSHMPIFFFHLTVVALCDNMFFIIGQKREWFFFFFRTQRFMSFESFEQNKILSKFI